MDEIKNSKDFFEKALPERFKPEKAQGIDAIAQVNIFLLKMASLSHMDLKLPKVLYFIQIHLLLGFKAEELAVLQLVQTKILICRNTMTTHQKKNDSPNRNVILKELNLGCL